MKTLFKNATVLTLNDKNMILLNTDVLVEGNTIKEVKKSIKCQADNVIDCTGKLLMPGFVNAHSHSPMTLYRGLGENTDFTNWWYDVMRPLEAKHKAGDYYTGALLAYLEMLKNGITTSCDCYMEQVEVAKAMADAGIRGVVAVGGITGKEVLDESVLDKQILAIKNSNPNATPILYAHSVYSCNEDIFTALVKYAKKHNLILTTHCSETLTEVGDCANKYDLTPVELLESYGFFDTKCLLAHCVHCDKEDVEILKNYDVSVVSCPSSNLVLGSGIAPIYSYVKNGVNVCLGTDGAGSNNSLDMFKEMFLVDNLQAGVLHQSSAINTLDTIKMATINGAQALNLNGVGKIEKGWLADIVLLDLIQPNMQPQNNLINNLVNSANVGNVYLTMVDGKVVYCNGKFYNGVNLDALYKQIDKIVKNF